MTGPSLVAILLSFVLSTAQAAPLRILIDPGHGGIDSGAVRGHLREADICLQVSKLLARKLARDPSFQVILSRDRDETVSLARRTQIAVQEKADVILSLHANVSDDTEIAGPEFYFQNLLPPDEYEQFLANRENQLNSQDQAKNKNKNQPHAWLSEKADVENILADLHHNFVNHLSAELAKTLHNHWTNEHRHHTKQVRQAPFYVISNVDVPSALVEMGYLSNPDEGAELADPSYQKQVATDIYHSLVQFKEMLDKQGH